MTKFRKWTDADTLHGRELLQQWCADSSSHIAAGRFFIWLHENVQIDMKEAEPVFRRIVASGDGARALKLYDAMMKDYSPRAHVVAKLGGCLLMLLTIFGLLGGALYLFRSCT